MDKNIFIILALIILSIAFKGCSQNEDIKKLNMNIKELRLEIDSLKTQRKNWVDYNVKGVWYLWDTIVNLYEKHSPKENFIKRIDFYDKPYFFYANNTMHAAIRYETDFNKVIVYDYRGLTKLGDVPTERAFLSFHLKSEDTLICLTEGYKGIYLRH